MDWQSKPTAPGVYWAYQPHRGVTVPVRVDLHPEIGLQVVEFGIPGSIGPNTGRWTDAEWYGPIETPARSAAKPVEVPLIRRTPHRG